MRNEMVDFPKFSHISPQVFKLTPSHYTKKLQYVRYILRQTLKVVPNLQVKLWVSKYVLLGSAIITLLFLQSLSHLYVDSKIVLFFKLQ